VTSILLIPPLLILMGGSPHLDHKGPSIYDVHTEGDGGPGSGGRMWMGSSAPHGRPHRKLKLESTDVILSSSHAKKLASLDRIKRENFSVI